MNSTSLVKCWNGSLVYFVHPEMSNDRSLTLWRPLLSYGYSHKASCARPG